MLSFWEVRRSIASVRLMADYGVEHGVPARVLLHGSDLTVDRARDAEIEITAPQELQVARNLLTALGEPTLHGVRIGRRYQVSTYGIWGYGLVASATLGASLALALRYLPLTFVFGRIRIVQDDAHVTMGFEEPDLAADLRAFLVARDMAAAIVLGRELVGAVFAPAALSWRTPDIGAAGHDVARVFGCTPQLGAARNALTFRRSILTTPLAQANPITEAACETICRDLLARRHMAVTTAAVLRDHLHFIGEERCSLGDAARFLGLGERTLKRRLQSEHTSFTAIVRDVRRRTACRMLANDANSVAEIGLRLGFSDASSFSQAFKRWVGVAPAAYRQARGDGGDARDRSG